MSKERIRFPDGPAMARVLHANRGSAVEVILRLAWDLGLSRDEICCLTWDQVSLSNRELVLPDRTVPMEAEVWQCLADRFARYCGKSNHVLLSDRLHRPMQPESVSRLARTALDTDPSLIGIRLTDLRYGFLLRQIEGHGWPYAARVGGMQASTMQALFLPAVRSAGCPETARRAPAAAEASGRMVREVIQKEGASPAGLALWMIWELGMAADECAALTWEQVDFERDILRLPDRSLPIDARQKQLLRALRDSCGGEAYVLLTPRSRRPYGRAELSKAIRAALVRGGAEATLQDLRRRQAHETADAPIVRCAAERGSISRREVMELLHMEKCQANRRLHRLTEEGKLVRIGARYYAAGTAVPPEEQYGAICAYLETVGTAYRKELAGVLHIGVRQCGWILRGLVEQGKLMMVGQRYALPEGKA